MSFLKRWAPPESPDDLFVAHYAQLLAWAQQLVGRDRSAAADLVHDAFLRLALRGTDLRSIANLEGYLFVTMRNVHLSQLRRRGTRAVETASLLDYESIGASLAAIGAQERREAARGELILIARYACIRKSSSKAASALILRFFHGYFPAEIASVLQTTSAAVDVRLRMARVEAQDFVADPERLRPFVGERLTAFKVPGAARDECDFIAALRRAIFETRTGVCLTPSDLDRLYAGTDAVPVDTASLAHIASCVACLDNVNRRFGFPLLSERDPSDRLGRGGRGAGPKNGSDSIRRDPRSEFRMRLRDVLDERPKELRIAVNGLFVGSQLVRSGVSEQRVKILVTERIGFIELFSEHGTCLLYLDIVLPPDGPAEQTAEVILSEGRKLSATLAFEDAAPVLHVTYEDPASESVRADAGERSRAALRAADHAQQALERPRASTGLGWRPAWVRLVTTMAVLCVAAIVGWTLWREPRVSAAEVLQTASAVESQALPAGVAAHRVLTVENRLLPAATVIARHRVEVWRDETRGIKVERLFDEQNRVVAGLWTRRDGTRTSYRAGERPSVGATSEPLDKTTLRDVWLHEASASDFAGVVGPANSAGIEVRAADYVLTYRPVPVPNEGLIEASLIVAKSDHRSTGGTIVLREDGETHEFTFSETSHTHIPAGIVSREVFEPDPVLLFEPPAPPEIAPVPLREAGASPGLLLTAVQIDQLELDSMYRLQRSRVWVGQEATVTRAPGGIAVRAVVPTEDRRSSLTRDFEELTRAGGVRLDVEVAAPGGSASLTAPNQAALTMLPAYPLLQKFFEASRPGEARIVAMQTFVSTVLEAVPRRQAHVNALRTLIDRWPEARLRQLPLESVVTWQVMVQEHAEAILQETDRLLAQLGPVFEMSVPAERKRDITEFMSTVDGAVQATSQLATLAAYQDGVLRTAFQPCAGASCPDVDADRLRESFVALGDAASRFARFYLKVGPLSTSEPKR
jgi:RNA polymerase sigma factor (sigma-70 family)